jgi:hypothetical protein
VVMTGGVFVLTPLSPTRMLWRLGRAALGTSPPAPSGSAPALPPSPGLLERMIAAGRRLFGGESDAPATTGDVTFPLSLTAREAEQGGSKRVSLRRADGRDEVLVTIPPGVRPGTRLRLRGKGRPLAAGGRGDAYLVVEVAGEGG